MADYALYADLTDEVRIARIKRILMVIPESQRFSATPWLAARLTFHYTDPAVAQRVAQELAGDIRAQYRDGRSITLEPLPTTYLPPIRRQVALAGSIAAAVLALLWRTTRYLLNRRLRTATA